MKRLYPDAKEYELEQMAKDVAAIIIPAEVHQKLVKLMVGAIGRKILIETLMIYAVR